MNGLPGCPRILEDLVETKRFWDRTYRTIRTEFLINFIYFSEVVLDDLDVLVVQLYCHWTPKCKKSHPTGWEQTDSGASSSPEQGGRLAPCGAWLRNHFFNVCCICCISCMMCILYGKCYLCYYCYFDNLKFQQDQQVQVLTCLICLILIVIIDQQLVKSIFEHPVTRTGWNEWLARVSKNAGGSYGSQINQAILR